MLNNVSSFESPCSASYQHLKKFSHQNRWLKLRMYMERLRELGLSRLRKEGYGGL